ncbi:hypothetical protein N752_16755 [Desulforamulus aquiferis]|nr:hypothetical protein N752_16755 [Desulforamulus aquiferis]
MLHLDRYAYNNSLVHIHPLERFLFSGVTLITSLILNCEVVSLLVILLMAWVTVHKGSLPFRFYFNSCFYL